MSGVCYHTPTDGQTAERGVFPESEPVPLKTQGMKLSLDIP